MKKYTFTRWMIVIILSIYGLTNTGMAQPITEKDDPAPTPKVNAPTPIKVSTTSFEDILVPWLMKNGQPVEQLDWVKDQKTKEITFTRQNKCQTVVKEGEVKWLPKFNNENDARASYAQKTANRALYLSMRGDGYSKRSADSLYRDVLRNMSWQQLDQIAANSPNEKRLVKLESDVAQLKANDAAFKDIFQTLLDDTTTYVQVRHFETFLELIANSFKAQGDFNDAVGEHLGTIKGRKHWEEMTQKYHLLVTQQQVVAPDTTHSTPAPTPLRF